MSDNVIILMMRIDFEIRLIIIRWLLIILILFFTPSIYITTYIIIII